MLRRCGALPIGLVLVSACSSDSVPDSARDGGGTEDAGRTEADASFDAGATPIPDAGPGDGRDAAVGVDAGRALGETVRVRVTLDGVPVGGARVSYGGSGVFVETSSRTETLGEATVSLRPEVTSFETAIIAAHPDARTLAIDLRFSPPEPVDGAYEVALERFDPSDDPTYPFADPGPPGDRDSPSQCGHCHERMSDDWFGSPHQRSASNPVVLDMYQGTAAALDAAACAELGGRWVSGRLPGGSTRRTRCYLGDGALHAVNPSCDTPSCDDAPEVDQCAACHAPGIDGTLSNRSLLEASGRSFEYGVHCDVCHHVEATEANAAPGVWGRLHVVRPSETGFIGLEGDDHVPLTFGPSWDSPNPRMGSVPRAHFLDATLCAGCHEYLQPARPGTSLDPSRWPGGGLPVHSTYSEWQASPYAPTTPCQSCHMPPDPGSANSSQKTITLPGVTFGWPRPPGSVRSHAFPGPRTPGGAHLGLAATVQLATRTVDGAFQVEATVQNVGAGHALPTGDPSRQVFLLVSATCGGRSLRASGGAVIGELGGVVEVATELSQLTGARPGDLVRAVRVGDFEDYEGPAPFELGGRLSVQAKGHRALSAVGTASVTASSPLQLGTALPSADRYYLIRPDAPGAPMLAGLPGASFARVMTDAEGTLAVPHHRAVDVLADTRLPPRASRSSLHRFALDPDCSEAVVARAQLIYRPLPRSLAAPRRWDRPDIVMTTETRR